ncbi:MAG: tRNA (adenosine(37)-N6)-threonylcarbamoyltransferase complex dimerization subunit type 1 TsaB [Amaricoccus sp.]|uniref:tRNA (adenosine(37)-N6)-threonylcarbamoyltransferase complex dimerization subunit type 1 TsaB n=1 Tax=Amaricoccus sp. TaxID=1872485 RepID=UPI0039E4A88B
MTPDPFTEHASGSGGAPLVLAFDTSAAHCAAALVRDGGVLVQRDEPMARGQAERLIPLLEELLAEAGHGWGDLDGLAVVTGPGNFTGQRLAVAAARGLALGLGIPAVGVTVFEALADGHAGALTVLLHDKRGTLRQHFQDGAPLGEPEAGPAEATPATGERADLATVAGIAARRLGAAPPPSPLYLRPADATPWSETVPLLDDA